jgi:endonuclease G
LLAGRSLLAQVPWDLQDTFDRDAASLEVRYELQPAARDEDAVVRHARYTLEYDDSHELAAWVAYPLTPSDLNGPAIRNDDRFKMDQALARFGTPSKEDYTRSPGAKVWYDRGHLKPAADATVEQAVMDETFLMSNICPMKPRFNGGGPWLELEKKVREWARTEGRVFVVVGPLVGENPTRIGGARKVAVPQAFYKVVLDCTGPEYKAIGFILPHKSPPRVGATPALGTMAYTVDAVEQASGLDFFPALPDDVEAEVEGTVNVAAWLD